ncbi:universal stress protein [Sphingomonas sp. UNC305MFCol5.2]|uniref:universal stress protein n=1 Tax=Sphingomonas sp. UNC305MFCol5.2 TaxID=1449076 RepID=UPI0004A6FB9B|nr:universal stress protein [Sphingomonas sp. UNC305MFCol5.2]
MKNVLVLMHHDTGQEARFQAALDLARALDGHLTCVDVAVVPVLAADFAMSGAADVLAADEQDRERRNRAHMEPRLAREEVPFTWHDTTGFLSPCMREAAGLADLIVLNRELGQVAYPDMRALVGEVVIKSGRAVVAVPESARGFDAFGHALIAWDGSPEAEAALRAAVPLLRKASAVTILEVADGSVKQPAEEAAAYLSRHDIRPVVRRESAMVDIPSTVILDVIDEVEAAYLVMGGFGHSRFVEAVFGGVSKRMLDECPVPLFLAH